MMKSIQLSAPFSGGATLIPNTFFDIFMPDANGEFVKVYLYLMRYFQSGCLNLSVLKIADTLHLTDGDVERALKYWASKGLLAISSDPSGNITNICLSGTGQDRLQNMGPVSPIPAPGGEKRARMTSLHLLSPGQGKPEKIFWAAQEARSLSWS